MRAGILPRVDGCENAMSQVVLRAGIALTLFMTLRTQLRRQAPAMDGTLFRAEGGGSAVSGAIT